MLFYYQGVMPMNKDLFYYPFYPKQWAIKTNILTLEEKGAYLEIINAIYINDEIEIFEKHIPNILGISKGKKYFKLMESLKPFLTVTNDNPLKYTQSKIKKIRLSVNKSLEQKSFAGKQSARARARNRAKQVQQPLNSRTNENSTNNNIQNTNIDRFSTISNADILNNMS
jgi:uncharacterized protein YdaU (DUF1376 family)|tara:strand:+ start:26 stop:535 length:510 start_codon:yes stop_codon:yes gene_type:complete